LQYAQLPNADFSDSNLDGVNLLGENLQGAYLRRTRLKGATLTGVIFAGANLEGANLRGAIFNERKAASLSIKKACNWNNAEYDKDISEMLGQKKIDQGNDKRKECEKFKE
jgi:uncharacterized protein YjbI with pentapeptide repeats